MPAFEGDEGQAHADIEGGEGGRPMTFTIQFTQFDGIILTEEGAEAGGGGVQRNLLFFVQNIYDYSLRGTNH